MRWAWRLFRREWRQQVLVLALLTVAIAPAIGFGTSAYNTTGVSESAVFGDANHLYEIDAPEADVLSDAVAAATRRFGPVGVIARWSIPVPGSVDSISFRAQDPAEPLTEPMLALVEGRYPSDVGEVALTDEVAGTLGLSIGGRFDLEGTNRIVVGIVENPSDLRSEFALVTPSDAASATSVTLLVRGSGAFDEVADLRDFGKQHLPNAEITSRSGSKDAASATAAASVVAAAAQALLLVSLVAAAGFITVTHRRLRQLGMLGAVGATERHLRLVVIGNGAVIGVIAALVGAVLGLTVWIAVAPRIEEAVGYRIDTFHLPWALIFGAMVLGLAAAVGAAWWPARSLARIPITRALSGRPAPARPARRSATAAAALMVVGTAFLVLGRGTNAVFVVTGTVAIAVGVLLLSPLVVEALGALGTRLRITQRLALRDLARHQARSAFALAAISFTLASPVANVVTASAQEQSAGPGNLSDRQILVWTRDPSQPEGVSPMYTQDPDDSGFSPYLPRLMEADLAELDEHVARMADKLDTESPVEVDLAVDPAVPETPEGRLAVTLAQRTEIGYLDVAPVFVATEDLLDLYGLEPGSVDPNAEIVTIPPEERLPEETRLALQSEDLWFGNVSDEGEVVTPEPITDTQTLASDYSSLPGSFITPEELGRRGWTSARVGWLLESQTLFTRGHLISAREMAAEAGLLIEARRMDESSAAFHWGATALGMVVALGVLAMTVGLLRNEAGADLRTLTATGATSGIRRSLTAATAGGLALSGALLGTLGAYLIIGANFVRDLRFLTPVPVAHIAAILVGVPFCAALVGWAFAGREPPAVARQAIE